MTFKVTQGHHKSFCSIGYISLVDV